MFLKPPSLRSARSSLVSACQDVQTVSDLHGGHAGNVRGRDGGSSSGFPGVTSSCGGACEYTELEIVSEQSENKKSPRSCTRIAYRQHMIYCRE